jgi:integrase
MNEKTISDKNYLVKLNGFKDYLYQNRKSKETVLSYQLSTKQFLNLINKEPKDINKQDLIKWKDYCQKYIGNTLTPKYGAVKKYIEYLIEQNILKEEFWGIVLRTLKAPKMQIDEDNLDKLVLKQSEYEQLFKVAKDRSFIEYAILKTAFWCSLRRKEVLGLNISDIDFKNRKLQLRAEITKGRKPATINISKECLDILNEYIQKHRLIPNADNKDALFIYENRRYSKTKLGEFMLIYKTLTNNPNLHFHMLRHTGITEYARVEKDVKIVQKQARHTDVNTTMRYINYTSGDYEKSYKEFEKKVTAKVPEPPKKPEEVKEPKPNVPEHNDINYAKTNIELGTKDTEDMLLRQLILRQIDQETFNKAIDLLNSRKKEQVNTTTNYYR